MILKEIRIYAEVLEQGLDFKSYLKDILQELHISASIKNIYSKKMPRSDHFGYGLVA